MYLRETKRRNADGSTVSYLALARNERDPATGVPRARIIHRFGRADQVDREGLARLVRSISRFLDPTEAVAATASGEVSILDSRPMGSPWLADRLWDRLEIGKVIIEAAGGRRLEAQAEERAFFTVASLLDLEVDLLFFDTSSTYWETDRLPEELQDQDDELEEDEEPVLTESGRRRYSKHSKDHRPDLPQVVVGMAVTRKGIPVRVWTFPGNASDQVIIRKVKDDLRGWNLARVIWVLDRGFTSERNRRYLQRAGGRYIVGEKLRSDSKEAGAALARQGRYHTVEGNLRVKQVRIDEGTYRDRFVICHNPERAERDRTVREQILERLRQEIHHADGLAPTKRSELYGALSTKPAYKRFLRRTKTGKLRIDRAAVARETKLDGKLLLQTLRREPERRG